MKRSTLRDHDSVALRKLSRAEENRVYRSREHIDWRLRWIEELLESPRIPRPLDAWTLRGLRWVQHERGLPLTPAPRQLQLLQPSDDLTVTKAFGLQRSGPLPPAYLEARLLAGASREQAAELCGLTLATVEAYEELFFGFRDHLHAKDWMHIHAIRFPEPGMTSQEGAAAVLRRLAYWGGPVVAEEMIRVLLQLGDFTVTPEWIEIDNPADPIAARVQNILGMELTPNTPEFVMRLFQIQAHAQQLQRQRGVPPTNAEQAEDCLQAVQETKSATRQVG